MAGLAGLLVAPKSLFAQQASAKIPRVGWIWIGGRAEGNSAEPAGFRQGLKELGYIEGQNITVEYRFGEGRRDRLADLVNELVQLRPDVLVALGDVTVRTAQAATTTIPVVSMTGDPVGVGLVASLARPGGNVTGVLMMQGGLYSPSRRGRGSRAVQPVFRLTTSSKVVGCWTGRSADLAPPRTRPA